LAYYTLIITDSDDTSRTMGWRMAIKKGVRFG
jgi:hypothetical protein